MAAGDGEHALSEGLSGESTDSPGLAPEVWSPDVASELSTLAIAEGEYRTQRLLPFGKSLSRRSRHRCVRLTARDAVCANARQQPRPSQQPRRQLVLAFLRLIVLLRLRLRYCSRAPVIRPSIFSLGTRPRVSKLPQFVVPPGPDGAVRGEGDAVRFAGSHHRHEAPAQPLNERWRRLRLLLSEPETPVSPIPPCVHLPRSGQRERVVLTAGDGGDGHVRGDEGRDLER
mmetsp:Transcript_19898/g.64756  ORF Transcript_19898/g.64756 Transcript_19898/m.64756 type:complete len:229 (+) Transcript_19898:479-1165(+)